MKETLQMLGFDPDTPEDALEFVKWLLNVCLWFFYIATSIIILTAIFKLGDGNLPPEAAWWLAIEKAIGVTW